LYTCNADSFRRGKSISQGWIADNARQRREKSRSFTALRMTAWSVASFESERMYH
jgi:hypothetical protein